VYIKDIFTPVIRSLSKNSKTLLNDISIIRDALKTGTIYYDTTLQGFKASTKFSASISKELESLGAVYNGRQKIYLIPFNSLPKAVQSTSNAVVKAVALERTRVLSTLDNISVNTSQTKGLIDSAYAKLSDDFKSFFEIQYRDKKGAIPVIQKQISDAMQEVINEKYVNNLDFYIKDFAEKETAKLRQQVQDLTLQGYRPEAISKVIEKEFDVTQNKANFLAKQESSLFMAELQTQEFNTYGAKQFKWHSSQDSRVRKLHKQLNQKIYSIDNPPVIDERTKQTGFPGQAFGCRCAMSAVF
jgi:SPP1 gp7 family putative phage head morphogenesis protein